jgi:hypothetical protein
MTKRVVVAGLAVVSLGLAFAGGWVAHHSPSGAPVEQRPNSTQAVVPNLVGQSVGMATHLLYANGLGSQVLASPAAAPGSQVTSQDPAAGLVVDLGTPVRLGVSPAPNGLVQGLGGQVNWDKAHLLDCWTAIVRTLSPAELKQIFRVSNLSGVGTDVATSGSLGHYVRLCRSDALG